MLVTVSDRAIPYDEGVGWRIVGGPHVLFSAHAPENVSASLVHGSIQHTTTLRRVVPTHASLCQQQPTHEDALVEYHRVQSPDKTWWIALWCDSPTIESIVSGRVMRDVRVPRDAVAAPNTPATPRPRGTRAGGWK